MTLEGKEIREIYAMLGAEVYVLYETSGCLMEIAVEYLGKDEAEKRLKRALQKRGINTD